MAEFKDNITGKQLVTTTPSEFKTLLAASSDDFVTLSDGTRLDPCDESRIPVRLKEGDQAKFVNLEKIATASDGTSLAFRDATRGVAYVPFRKQDYQDGVLAAAEDTFSTNAFSQISASLTAQFNLIPTESLFTYAVEEFYTASGGFTFIGPVTSSFVTLSPEGSASFSGIANDSENSYDLTFDFSKSNFVANLSIRGTGGNDLIHQIFVPSFPHKFLHTGIVSHSIGLTTSSLTGVGTLGFPTSSIAQSPASGASCFSSITKNINGSDASSGQYRAFFLKGRVAGDADSGSLYDFLGTTPEILIYSSSVTVASGSFRYQPLSPNDPLWASQNAFRKATTGSSDIRTLYYVSGSNNGPSGSHTGSGVSQGFPGAQAITQLGSPVHGDPNLRTTASYGYYSPVGTGVESQKIYRVNTASFDNEGFTLSGIPCVMKVGRFTESIPAP